MGYCYTYFCYILHVFILTAGSLFVSSSQWVFLIFWQNVFHLFLSIFGRFYSKNLGTVPSNVFLFRIKYPAIFNLSFTRFYGQIICLADCAVILSPFLMKFVIDTLSNFQNVFTSRIFYLEVFHIPCIKIFWSLRSVQGILKPLQSGIKIFNQNLNALLEMEVKRSKRHNNTI